jgi:pre-mRNA-processing factor 39
LCRCSSTKLYRATKHALGPCHNPAARNKPKRVVVVKVCTELVGSELVVCGKEFSSAAARREHYLAEHKDPKLVHKCWKCDKSFHDYNMFRVHSRGHTDRFRCDDCGRIMSSKQRLELHRHNKHSGQADEDNDELKRTELINMYNDLSGRRLKRTIDWQKLVTKVEEVGDRKIGIKVFEELTEAMPMWDQMWIRFFDFLDTRAVLDMAVKEHKRSVQLWRRLLEKANEEEEEKLRELFEEAVTSAGGQWDSAPLWRDYIVFEANKGRVVRAMRLFIRALKLPIYGHQKLLMELQDMLILHNPQQLVFLMEKAKETASKVEGEVEARAVFELKITNEFAGNLKNDEKKAWSQYVASMEEKNPSADLTWLFERYVARCHSCPEAWISYTAWLASQPTPENIELLRGVMNDSRTYLGLNTDVFLHWAEVEEGLGYIDRANQLLEILARFQPGLKIDMTLNRASLMQRNSDNVSAKKLYREAVYLGWDDGACKGGSVTARHAKFLLVTGEDATNVVNEALQVHNAAQCIDILCPAFLYTFKHCSNLQIMPAGPARQGHLGLLEGQGGDEPGMSAEDI